MNMRKIHLKDTMVLLVVILLVSQTLFMFTPTTRLANAEEIGQIKVKEGFEFTFPPPGWIIQSPLSVIQTTGLPGGECIVGHHAAKIFRSDSRFFCQMYTPLFNGKKGGGNILTFWHKQAFLNQGQITTVFVTNDLSNYIQIADYTSSMNWTYEKINLNEFIHPTKTMQVLFLTILLHNGDNAYLDEVTITGVSGE
jgi:hypothetical protein